MKFTHGKKIILALAMIVLVVFMENNIIFAATNQHYKGNDGVSYEHLEESMSDSIVLSAIAKLIYSVGRLIEWILGTIFNMLTGSSDFPWADKIVFNAVPLLDVNFLNPSTGSFVGNLEIQVVLKNIYATILALAVEFFGVAVLITAVKLVVSSTATDKAKYKKAITEWLVGFILIFCIHYAISFIFYLNEQLVMVASKLVSENLKAANRTSIGVQTGENVEKLINRVKATGVKYAGKPVHEILSANKVILQTWMYLASEDRTLGLQQGLMSDVEWWTLGDDIVVGDEERYTNLGMIISWAADDNITVDGLLEIKNKIKAMEYYGCYGNITAEVEGLDELVNKECEDYCSDLYYDPDMYGLYTDEELKEIWAKEDECIELCEPSKVACDDTFYENQANGMSTEESEAIYYVCLKETFGEEVETTTTIECNENKKYHDQALSIADIYRAFGDTYIDFILTLDGENGLEYIYTAEETTSNPKVLKAKAKANKEIQTEAVQRAVLASYKYNDTKYLLTSGAHKLELGFIPVAGRSTVIEWTSILNDLIAIKQAKYSGETKRLLSGLADWFRNNAYEQVLGDDNDTALEDGSKVQIQNMIMYAILVGQSLILFIAYVKRLFYVILLAMMAPVVAVFDFFQKFGK